MSDDKSKSFKKIEDLLNMDSSTPFDDDEAKRELELLEERRKRVKEYKVKLEELAKVSNLDDYSNQVLKEMVEKGMSMLSIMQMEIEDNPKARDVETVTMLMTSINSIIDNINKIKFNNSKLNLEERKLALKQSVIDMNAPAGITANQQNNFIMVGDTNDIMKMLQDKGIVDSKKSKKVIDAEVEKTEDN